MVVLFAAKLLDGTPATPAISDGLLLVPSTVILEAALHEFAVLKSNES